MNLFLFPSITVFYYFCSFKCLFASDCSHSSYKRFHSPTRAAGSCCPDCLHPNLQDPYKSGIAEGIDHVAGSALLLPAPPRACRVLGWVPSLHLPGPGFGQDDQHRAWSCKWMYPDAPSLDSAGTAPAGLSLGLLGARSFRNCLCLSPASCFRHSGPMPAAWAPVGMVGVPGIGQCCYPVLAAVCKQCSQLWPVLGAG